MKKRFTNFLNQPYPFYYRGRSKWAIAAAIFLMTFLFCYLFEPFEVYVPEHRMNYFWITVIHSTVSVTVILIFFLMPVKPTAEEYWSVRKEMFVIAIYFLTVGIAQFLIRDIIYDNPYNWSWQYFYEEIRNTFMIGILFAAILIPLNFIRLIARNSQGANALSLVLQTSGGLQKSAQNPALIKIEDQQIQVDKLLFAKAEGNYVCIHLMEEQKNKLLKRITFKELETLLAAHANILKTHRSYLVNIDHVIHVAGNAQGYKLKLKNCELVVPVSRNMIGHFNSNNRPG